MGSREGVREKRQAAGVREVRDEKIGHDIDSEGTRLKSRGE